MGRIVCFVNSLTFFRPGTNSISLRVVYFNSLFKKFFSSGNPVAILIFQGHFYAYRLTRDVIILVCFNHGVRSGCHISHNGNQRWCFSNIVAVKLWHQRQRA